MILDYHHLPICAIMLLFFGAFFITTFGTRGGVRKVASMIASALSLACLIALIKPVMIDGEIISYWLGNRSIAGGYAIGIAIEVDALSLFFGLLVGIAAFAACLYSLDYITHDAHQVQYYTLLLMTSGGVLGMVLTGDIFNMYIMVEILTIGAVGLTAYRSKSEGALEAAFKYLAVGSIGSAFILTAIVMLYAEAHTLNLAQLSVLLPGMLGSGRMKIAFALLLAGFSTKAFIVPFHPLAADAHGAAPASVSLLISGVLTKSGLYAIIRLCYFLFQVMDKGTMQFLLVFLGCVSMLVCVTMALAQHDFKRLLAFHSISQIGYVLTAVGLATALGLSAGLYHAMNHTIFKGLLFLAAGAVMHQTGTGDLDRLGGLAKKMPHTTVMFLIGAFSISGLPPFNGFASKWMIYQAIYQKAVESGNFLFVFALIAALVTSVLTLASFVKVSQSVFFGQLSVEFENTEEAPIGMRIAMGLLAALCVITGLFPNLVTAFLTEPAATAALSVGKYISAMGFDTTLAAPVISFVSMGVWAPVNWLLLLCITLLAITIAAVSTRYDAARTAENVTDTKYQLFYGGEKNVYSQVGGEDLFWGLKHNWRHYFDFMHKLHSGVVNDYALWAVVDVTVIMAFMLIAL
ncbi:MAG: proton-conducting transporter membrane subunit [Candidatus Limivicinus sp.]|nr:proton-conducting transporter membrane subunit [Candidatus Limivicinus sp.]